MKLNGEYLKAVILMVAVNCGFGIVNVLFKHILHPGINHMVIVTYRLAIATLFLTPIAYFKERKSRPKLTISILIQLFFSAIVGASLTQYFFLLGLEYTSTSFSSAFLNMVPAVTFILALIFKQEKLETKSKGGKAKLLGALICIGGTLVLTLYKGMPLNNKILHAKTLSSINPHKWALGSILLVTGSTLWSLWFIVQAKISKQYPSQFSSTAILSFFASIQSAMLSLVIDRNPAVWILKGNFVILTVVYSGVVASGLCYVGMCWCVKERGPVFTSAFIPFTQIFASIIGFLFLPEQFYLGSIVGSVVLIIGLYILLWGKQNDPDECVDKQGRVGEKSEVIIPVSIIGTSICEK